MEQVISQLWDLIETWRFHVYDPYDLPDNSISPPDKFIKPNPNSVSSRKAEKFKFEIDRKIVDRQTDRPKDRVIPTIRRLWIKSTSLNYTLDQHCSALLKACSLIDS